MDPFPRGSGGFGAKTQVLEFPLIPLNFLLLFISIFKVLFKEKLLFQTYSLSLKISL